MLAKICQPKVSILRQKLKIFIGLITMKLYFSGIGGVGLAPLALIAKDCGLEVYGSDKSPSLSSAELEKKGIEITYQQNLEEIQVAYKKHNFNWLVVTAALPQNHPHLQFAKENNIKISKRDELLNYILEQKKLKLIAVAGTHGKTTTTAMIVWLFKQNNIPVSYLIGSSISFGTPGKYQPESNYFILECDEFDKNFLHFHPEITVITSLDYDHPDSYPTKQEYINSFNQFLAQTKEDICIWNEDYEKLNATNITAKIYKFNPEVNTTNDYLKIINLAGQHNRKNGFLAISATSLGLSKIKLFSENQSDQPAYNNKELVNSAKLNKDIATFPGTVRRFEKITTGLYSDYAHHPVEIAATIQLAKEIQKEKGFNNLVIVYQPHQNLRQQDQTIQQGYKNCFQLADSIYWLPTYLSREKEGVEILNPVQIAKNLEGFILLENTNPEYSLNKNSNFLAKNIFGLLKGRFVILDDQLKDIIKEELENNNLVICFGAGNIDEFVRTNFKH
jgi:UDP-N-acetylmuramate--alanine ligase